MVNLLYLVLTVTLKVGDKISGRGSLTTAQIDKIKENKGIFDVDFSYKTNMDGKILLVN